MIIADRVKETTTSAVALSAGATVNLAGAATQFQSFINAVGNGNPCQVCFLSGNGTDWQVCNATVNSGSPNTLTIGSFIASSTGSAITLVAPSTVYLDVPASWFNAASGFLIGKLIGANFNSTADQAIALSYWLSPCIVSKIIVTNPSTSLTTAQGGIYTGAGKTGGQIVSSSQTWAQMTTNAANTAGNALILTGAVMINVTTLYFSLTTAQGAAATADIYIYAG
jgi:hypothetical protein